MTLHEINGLEFDVNGSELKRVDSLRYDCLTGS